MFTKNLHRGQRTTWPACAVAALSVALPRVAAQIPTPPRTAVAGVVNPITHAAVEQSMHRAMDYLASIQNENGSWGGRGPESELEANYAIETYASWRLGAHAIACSALCDAADSPARVAMLDKAVNHLCTVTLPQRDSDWDIDYVWAAVYGFSACVELLQDARFGQEPWEEPLEARGKEWLAVLLRHQALSGGWAYYDEPPYARTPTWATSFTTAAVVPALHDAKHNLGWTVPDRVLERALRYIERCALPNGAYAYSLSPNAGVTGVEHINQIQGSLSRIQVCNWALARAGVGRISSDVLRSGLQAFFDHHGFLDHVRTRPIPHEGFHANAGYFYFFGHYYAAKVIALLPLEEQQGWYDQLSPHLTKTQWKSGGASDFMVAPYAVVAGTSFLISGLRAHLEPR